MAKPKRDASGQFVKAGSKKAAKKSSGGGRLNYAALSDAQLLARIKRSGLDIPLTGYAGGGSRGSYGQRGVPGGTNLGRDGQRRALPPGWRVSASGNKYFENRRNRSDKNRNKTPWL